MRVMPNDSRPAVGARAVPTARNSRCLGGRMAGCKALPLLLAILCPTAGHAGEAGVDVPMRRGAAETRQTIPAAAPEGLFGASQTVLGEIEVLRREFGVDEFPVRAERHRDRGPVHVYVKALEVMSKVVALQRRLGVPEGYVRELPPSAISSDEVVGAVQDVLGGIDAIKAQMAITSAPDAVDTPARLRTLAMTYLNLADASTLLDGLVGRELTLRDVFRNVTALVDDINLVGTMLQVPLDTELPDVSGERGLVDVAQQAMRAAFKTIALQVRLGMDPSAVPTLTMVRVSPTEAHDLTGILRAELARIKWHLGINVAPVEVGDVGIGRDTTDLFARMLLIVRNLDQLTAGVGS